MLAICQEVKEFGIDKRISTISITFDPPAIFSFYLHAVFNFFFSQIFVFDVLYNVMMMMLPKHSPQISSICG